MSIMVVFINTYCCFCKSEDFQPAYGRINEVLALIPRGVPYVGGSSKIQTLLHDSSSIEIEVYSDGNTLRLFS